MAASSEDAVGWLSYMGGSMGVPGYCIGAAIDVRSLAPASPPLRMTEEKAKS
jgi:hypothetical protein